MTIEELNPAPQDAGPSTADYLENLMRALADQAKAANQRSTELAERVALLEGRCDMLPLETDETTCPAPQAKVQLRSTRVAFSQGKEEFTMNISLF